MKLSLKSIGKRVIKRWYIMFFFPLFFGISSYVIQNYVQEKNYQSNVELLILPKVSNELGSANDANIRLNIQLMNTYMNVMKSTPVLNEVRKEAELSESVSSIRKNMFLIGDENSLSFTLRLNSTSPEKSEKIANQITHSTQKYLESLFPENKLIVLNAAEKGTLLTDNTSVIIAITMGAWLSMVIIIWDMLNTGIIRETEQLSIFGFPVIGQLPSANEAEKSSQNGLRRRRRKNV